MFRYFFVVVVVVWPNGARQLENAEPRQTAQDCRHWSELGPGAVHVSRCVLSGMRTFHQSGEFSFIFDFFFVLF